MGDVEINKKKKNSVQSSPLCQGMNGTNDMLDFFKFEVVNYYI